MPMTVSVPLGTVESGWSRCKLPAFAVGCVNTDERTRGLGERHFSPTGELTGRLQAKCIPSHRNQEPHPLRRVLR